MTVLWRIGGFVSLIFCVLPTPRQSRPHYLPYRRHRHGRGKKYLVLHPRAPPSISWLIMINTGTYITTLFLRYHHSKWSTASNNDSGYFSKSAGNNRFITMLLQIVDFCALIATVVNYFFHNCSWNFTACLNVSFHYLPFCLMLYQRAPVCFPMSEKQRKNSTCWQCWRLYRSVAAATCVLIFSRMLSCSSTNIPNCSLLPPRRLHSVFRATSVKKALQSRPAVCMRAQR